MSTDRRMAAEATIEDHIRRAIELMTRGARINLSGIPDDPTFLSSNFGPEVSVEIAKRLSTVPSAGAEAIAWADPITIAELAEGGEDFPNPTLATRNRGVFTIPLYTHPPASEAQVLVKVKPLEWTEKIPKKFVAETIVGRYAYRIFFTGFGATKELPNHPTLTYWPLEEAQAFVQADFERHILPAITPEQGETAPSYEIQVVVTDSMVAAAKTAYWHEVHNGGGYSDKCYEAAIRAAFTTFRGSADV